MKINQLPDYKISTYLMSLNRAGAQLPSRAEAYVSLSSSGQILCKVGSDLMLKPANDQVEATLRSWLAINPHFLSYVVFESTKEKAELRLLAITKRHDLEEMNFAIDDAMLAKAKQFKPLIKNIDALIKWLTEECILEPSPNIPECQRLLVTSGKELDPDLPQAYTIHGRSIRVGVVTHALPNGEVLMRVDRITRTRSKLDPELPVRLLVGTFAFKDNSNAARTRYAAEQILTQLFAEDDLSSYLASWENYGRNQTELSFEQVLDIGALCYEQYRPIEGGQVLFVLSLNQKGRRDRASKLAAAKDQDISISSAPPAWANLRSIDLELLENSQDYKESTQTKGRFLAMTEDGLILEVEQLDSLPEKGVLFVSLKGDLTVILRRYKAQRAIKGSHTPIPHLGVLLEGATISLPMLQSRYPALSDKVNSKVFPQNAPTFSQRQAIECALNTPDIALIQGPPGTGKTTVIQAIVERLNEIYRPEDTRAGQFIITSYQHDAVENALERITVNGLPSPKIGQRTTGGVQRDDTELSSREREDFAEAIKARLKHSTSQGIASQKVMHDLDYLQNLLRDFHQQDTTPESALVIIKKVRGILSFHCPGARAAQQLLHLEACVLEQSSSPRDVAYLLRRVWALRVCEISHADDGPTRAAEFLEAFDDSGNHLSDAEREALSEAMTSNMLSPDNLDLLRIMRRRVMSLLSDPRSLHPGIASPLRAEIAAALVRALEELQEHRRLTLSSDDRLRLDFLRAVEDDPKRFTETLRHYTVIHGVTCQQIASHYFSDAHGDGLVHDAILIDEAARANPLDLFIPMSRGKKIILVGDHRQLPHIVEDEILKRMLEEAEGSPDSVTVQEVIREQLEASLFYKLFTSIVAQEKVDGIKRTVTLSDQFRMHPELGAFVGEHFYAAHGEPYNSPLQNLDHFAHGLERYAGRFAVWIDVPNALGGEVRGQSKSRPVEAEKVAQELKQLLEDDHKKSLSFGVITFYREQVNEIQAACDRLGITDELRERRVIIGTVDAFQGKEFDVVLLSMVRSTKLSAQTALDERARRRVFGHLMNSNRMCVAFSRQKKLLIVVGDKAMLTHPDSKESIKPLVAFHRLTVEGATHV